MAFGMKNTYLTNSTLTVDMVGGKTSYPFPYGFANGTTDNYIHSSSIALASNVDYPILGTVTYMNVKTNFTIGAGNTVASTPFLNWFKIEAVDLYTYTYTVSCGDADNGIYSITIAEDGDIDNERLVVIKEAGIQYGSINDGYFTFTTPSTLKGVHHSAKLTITLKSRANTKATYTSGQFLKKSFTMVPYLPVKVSWTQDNINTISFLTNSMDTSNVYATNTMYITFKGIPQDINMVPRVHFHFLPNPSLNNNFVFSGKWVAANSRYEIPFQVPQNLPLTMSVNYDLLGDTRIPLALFEDIVNSNGRLTVTSTKPNMMPPVFSKVERYNYAECPDAIPGWALYGWDLTVSTTSTSYFGNITAISPRDPYPIVIHFTQANSVNGVIRASFNVSHLVAPQTYTISSGYISDGVNVAQTGVEGFLDPLYLITSNNDVVFSCPTSDYGLPKMTNFLVSTKSVDVGSSQRSFYVTLDVYDVEEVNFYQHPFVYITSLMGDTLSFPSVVSSRTGSQVFSLTNATYNASITIPYGWGSSDLLISVYNIMDTQNHFLGFSSVDLAALGYQNNITRVFNPNYLPSPPTPPIPSTGSTPIPNVTPTPATTGQETTTTSTPTPSTTTTTDPNQPTTNTSGETTGSPSSIISIVEIRELNVDGTVRKSFPLNESTIWMLEQKEQDNTKKGLSSGAIAGIAVGASAVGIAAACCVGYVIYRRRQKAAFDNMMHKKSSASVN
eukprot:gene3846-4441_t